MTNEERVAFIDTLGLTYTGVFVPYSKSRSKAAGFQSLNWSLTLTKGRQSMTTDYSAGVAHIPGWNHKTDSASRKIGGEPTFLRILETGKAPSDYATNPWQEGFAQSLKWKDIPLPPLLDVVHCLVVDAEALNYANFEAWAGEFGYGEDSRKAEQTYRTCLDIALQLRALVGPATLEQLRTVFEGY